MKLSEVIAKLGEILEAEGDIDVECYPEPEQGTHEDLTHVEAIDGYGGPGKTKRVVRLDARYDYADEG